MTENYSGPTLDEIDDRIERINEHLPTEENFKDLPPSRQQELADEIDGELGDDIHEVYDDMAQAVKSVFETLADILTTSYARVPGETWVDSVTLIADDEERSTYDCGPAGIIHPNDLEHYAGGATVSADVFDVETPHWDDDATLEDRAPDIVGWDLVASYQDELIFSGTVGAYSVYMDADGVFYEVDLEEDEE